MKILIVSDAWHPQINGVVRTLDAVAWALKDQGHTLGFITPDQFSSVPCPTYPDICLAAATPGSVGRRIRVLGPDAIHIATEGPLGWAARRFCLRQNLPFTTSYHTHFPEYVRLRTGIPANWSYALMRRFHRPSQGVLVATPTLRADLAARGFVNLRLWPRGVDTELFRPRPELRSEPCQQNARPIHLFVGRVAVEKNLEAFLALNLPGTKLVVGDGPQLARLRARYPDTCFAGAHSGEALARYYASADVFVFPSCTDTFGLVILEALASGLPVAAYPVPGPQDIIGDQPVGCLHPDLETAIRQALLIPREHCRAFAERYSWSACAAKFASHIHPLSLARTHSLEREPH